MSPEFHEIEHVQLDMPDGGGDAARAFYVGVLGLAEIEKPAALSRSGAWYRAGRVELHLSVEHDICPRRRAHPGIRVTGLDPLAARCRAAGYDPQFDARYPGRARFFVIDPFGNRLELFETRAAGA